MKLKYLSSIIAVLAISISQAQNGHGLIVAVSDLEVQPKDSRTLGAPRDGARLAAMLKGYGISVKDENKLIRSQAKLASIRAGLTRLKSVAKTGDQIVFAYSGPGTRLPDSVAGLATQDSTASSTSGDLSMQEISKWAGEVESKGASVWIFVDAAWNPVLSSRSGDLPSYRKVSKFLERSGDQPVSDPLYSGKGTFISATSPRGRAYEWKIAPETDTYSGAFTEVLTRLSLSYIKRSKIPNFNDLLVNLAVTFRRNSITGYMPEQKIWTNLWDEGADQAVMVDGALGNRNFLGVKRPAPNAVVADPFADGSKLRIGIEVVGAADDNAAMKIREKLEPDFLAYASKHLPMIEVVGNEGYRPDRIIHFFPQGTGFGAVLTGMDTEPGIMSRNPRVKDDFSKGTNINEILNDSYKGRGSDPQYTLKQIIRFVAAHHSLYGLADTATPTWTNQLELTLGQMFKNYDPWQISVKSQQDGTALIFGREDWTGFSKLYLPEPGFGKTILTANTKGTFPNYDPANFQAFTPDDIRKGRVLVRVIAINDKREFGKGKDFESKVTFLEDIVSQIQKNALKWTYRDTSYLLMP